jgi:hypothetical protein
LEGLIDGGGGFGHLLIDELAADFVVGRQTCDRLRSLEGMEGQISPL